MKRHLPDSPALFASAFCAVLLCALPLTLAAQDHALEQGTIVRMRMTDCLGSQHALMDTLSGSRAPSVELCPEYVLVTNKVVYVIAGKASDQLVPLAETTRFHFKNNEVLIRVDDARHEARFHVREMILRTDWDRRQQIEEDALAAAHHHVQEAVVVDARQ
jgi:hypothetical protein